LVANDIETLALAAAASGAAAEIGTARIPATLTTLRLAQIALVIIFLLALRKRKTFAALGACDLNVWHGSFFSLRKRKAVARIAFIICCALVKSAPASSSGAREPEAQFVASQKSLSRERLFRQPATRKALE
jgi:hypothetical protein